MSVAAYAIDGTNTESAATTNALRSVVNRRARRYAGTAASDITRAPSQRASAYACEASEATAQAGAISAGYRSPYP